MILRLGQGDTEILLLIHLRLTLQDLTTTTAAAVEEEEEDTRVTTITRPAVIVMAGATLDVTLDVTLGVIRDVGVDMVMIVAVTIGPRTEAVEIAMDQRLLRLTRAEATATITIPMNLRFRRALTRFTLVDLDLTSLSAS